MGMTPLDQIFPPRRLAPDAPLRPLPQGGFRLHFANGECYRIEGADTPGEQYARDFLSALRAANHLPAGQCVLEDAPVFARRGFMLDISRDRVPAMDWLKWLVERLARLRYNELQLYTEHTFAYTAHRTVWARLEKLGEGFDPETDDDVRTAWSLLYWATAQAIGLKTGQPPGAEAAAAETVRERFRDNWLRHSRPGGLDESARRNLRCFFLNYTPDATGRDALSPINFTGRTNNCLRLSL